MAAANNDQIRGMLDRAVAVGATMLLSWCVKKGYLGESDAATLTPALILLPSLAWGWWNNRNTALLQSAASVIGPDGKPTIIVASPEMAAATPAQTNIVSNTDVKVIAK